MEADLLPQFLKMFAALVFVLALIGGLALALKKLGLGGVPTQNAGKKKRLKVIEALTIDPRRRLVLVQRDDVEHLILLGGNEANVIETGIAVTDNEDHE